MGELRGEVIKNVRAISQPVQKEQGLAFAAPIQIVQPHAVDAHESSFVRLGVFSMVRRNLRGRKLRGVEKDV